MGLKKIWLSAPHMGGTELSYVQEAYDTNWVAPLGFNVDSFETDIEKYTQSKHCAALSSGTAALHLALILCDVKPGDYVICQSLTFSASANPIAYLGAIPILIDSESSTWNMSSEHLENAIQEAINGRLISPQSKSSLPPGKPKAIIPVHLYGMPANMKSIMEVAQKYDIPVIEDAAESLGSIFMGQSTGTFGKMGVLSFNGNKIITTSGGGALLSDEENLIQRARFLATQARDKAPHYEHSQIGYNYRMSNILAGIGRGQMSVLARRVQERRANNLWYRTILAGIEGIELHSEPNSDYFSNYWLTAITIDPEKTGVTSEELRNELLKSEIESRPLWKPMHLQPVFAEAPYYGEGVSDRIFKLGLCLPSGSNMTDLDRSRIKKAIYNIL